MDGVDPELVETAEAALAAEPGVTEVRSVKMRWIGHRLHADAELDIDPATTLTDAHRIAHEAEHTLTHAVPKLSSALVHAYPATAADRLADMRRHVAAASRSEPGNLPYTVSRGGDRLRFYLHDRGRASAAVHGHQRSDHFRATVVEFGRLIHEADIRVLSTVDDRPEKS
jgi:quinol monooxygenase YgiN